MKTLIRHGRVIDPASRFDQVADIGIQDGYILFIGSAPTDFMPDEIIEAEGLIVCPGLVDASVRLRNPASECCASMGTELQAAAAGGITSLAVPPDTDPPLDEPGLVHTLKQSAAQIDHARIYPIGALTIKLKGELITEMRELAEAGCVAFSQADKPLTNTIVLQRSMQYAATFGFPVWLRPAEPFLARSGIAHDGAFATLRGLPAIPAAAELIALYTYIEMMRLTGVRLHIQQISSARSLALIQKAKAEGLPITCDVSAHHVHLCDTDIGFFDTNCLVFPPLRAAEDRAALRKALMDGTIDAICSDHAPVDNDAKLKPFMDAEPGISGVETLLSLTLRWAEESNISLVDALAKVTINPANILGIEAGRLQINHPADICLFDPKRQWTPDSTALKSFGKNTPFINQPLTGKTVRTLVNGITVYAES